MRAYNRLTVSLLCTSLILFTGSASAFDGNPPLPKARPDTSTKTDFAPARTDITSSIAAATANIPVSSPLKDGLDALSNKKAADAIAIRDGMAKGSLDRHILTWAIALSNQKGVPSYEIAQAQQELKGWPGLGALRANSERALARENPPAADVLVAFGSSQPETPEGTVALARADIESGNTAAAATLLRGLWSAERLDKDIEDKILAEFPTLLTTADHRQRMEMLLYRGKLDQAARFSDLGKAQSLYRAWIAVARNAANAPALVAAVDSSWAKSPAYLFIRVELLRKQEKYEEAAQLLLSAPNEAAALVNPSEWWIEERIVSRGLLDKGDFKGAYRVAANHSARDASDIVDAEFHAGWYALRGLNDAETAASHFRKILAASNRPISVSRANYWLGRAAEAGAAGSATEYFTKAAKFSGTFYGQLAAARLGGTSLNVTYPSPTAADRATFENREAVQAIARLEAAGHGWRADKLYRALAEDLTSPGELAILATQAEKTRGHQLSLQIGKLAFGRGMDVAALAFPLGVIPVGANIAGSGKALAYAIARQESAFNPAAISPANARGLLQILPGTAKGVAGRHGLAYSKDRLTTDAGYNATLGAHYLGEQIDSFGGSYILTFIAYNAGPRRIPEWLNRYGDPRGKPIDEVVDWIERIPFAETRGYVQRVMENYQVYKTRLGQKADIVNDLRMGRNG
ncbi:MULTISPECIES: lytic transglycosylase domain-containing protein [unclassified Rhizobium]|uniref:lytic transglycosylase domain-containing protein n=1 Tax=unclassified Rhizobium TaxID=2613769 RepID=UPI0006F670CC|nr:MULTISPECIES: lytic transglycosylase domain-containing protein [unclassified Rhizobium]KQV43479.1 lytic transglycosylase [Rhizobium sp. Root1212]KRD37664.1 lytic transglycosylase [Rhizobium sp. Root268]